MDHHCPWINNCIGFYNRKYFIQLLSYVVLSVLFIVVAFYRVPFENAQKLFYQTLPKKDYAYAIVVVVSYLINLVFSFIITKFYMYHIDLVLDNLTTIESLDAENKTKKRFFITRYENWVQVFGENKLLWLVPMVTESGMPKGTGLSWATDSFVQLFGK